jgi:Zn-finger nucleic acid-binding protein
MILYKCSKCHGLWLTGNPLRTFREALTKFELAKFEVYWHDDGSQTYTINSCARCLQVLEEFHYGYNTGAYIYRCRRCQGMWLPLRQLIHLIESAKLGQSVAADARALLIEIRKEVFHFAGPIHLLRWLIS